MDLLGAGSAGEVWRGLEARSGRPVALKVFKPDTGRLYYSELAATLSLRHENLVRLEDLWDETKGRGLVLELCSGGSLRDVLNRAQDVSLKDFLAISDQVCNALDYLHSRKMTHGDIKPENLLRARATGDPHWKIADFGLAQASASKKADYYTPRYAAPEQFRGKISPASDVYSFGKVLIECLGKISTQFEPGAVGALESIRWLCESAVAADPAQRITAAKLAAEIRACVADSRVSRHSHEIQLMEFDESDSLNFPGLESRNG